ncbi:MAG: hypothetical protein ACRELF_17940, partial [Gemmataceae bacterium]
GGTVADSVEGGPGSLNVVLANGFTLSGSQSFSGLAAAANMITVQGTADLTTHFSQLLDNQISDIQTIDLNSGAVLTVNTAELNNDISHTGSATLEPTIAVAAGGTGTLVVNDTSMADQEEPTKSFDVNLTGLLHGVTSLTVDGGATLTVGTTDIASLASVSTQVQGVASGVIVSSVAGVEQLQALDPHLIYGLSDTVANLIAAPSLLANAKLITTPSGALNIAQAVQLTEQVEAAGGSTSALAYTVADTPQDVLSEIVYNDERTALQPGGTAGTLAAVALTGPATVVQAENIAKAQLNIFPTGISISDTAANLGDTIQQPNPFGGTLDALDLPIESYHSTALAGTYSIAFSGTADLTQAVAIEDYVDDTSVTLGYVSASGSFSISTTIAEINHDNGNDPTGTAAALKAATSVTLTPGSAPVLAVDVAAALKIMSAAGVTLGGTYSLSDTSADILAQSSSILANAAAVTVTDVIGVATAAAIVNGADASVPVTFQELQDTATALTSAA